MQTYLDEIDSINSELQVQRTELTTVNDGFNNDREIEYGATEERFEAVDAATQELATHQSGLTLHEGLDANQQSLMTAIELASDNSITEALDGLRSTDTAEQRNSAVEAMGMLAGLGGPPQPYEH